MDEGGVGKPEEGKAMGKTLTWGKVRGPAGATFMSCKRAGWSWPKYDEFLTRQGLTVKLGVCCPRDVQAMAAKDAEAVRRQAWTRQGPISSWHRPH